MSTEIDWKDEWFATNPRDFWKSSTESHRKFLLNFAKKYNIVHPQDWGRIRTRHIGQEKGSGLLKEYSNNFILTNFPTSKGYSLQEALKRCFPGLFSSFHSLLART